MSEQMDEKTTEEIEEVAESEKPEEAVVAGEKAEEKAEEAGTAEKKAEEKAEEAETAEEKAEEKAADSEKQEKKAKVKSLVGKIVNWVEWILLAVSLGMVIYAFVCTARGKAVNFFGNSLLHVVTGSMEPTIETGEYVFTKEAAQKDLAVGDIVAYYSEDPQITGRLVIHRIKEIREDGLFITMGDANPVPDPYPVRYDQIQGRLSGRAHIFNWISSFADPRKLLLMLVVIPIFFLSIYEAGTLGKLVKGARMNNPVAKKKEKEAYDAAVEEIRKKAVEEYLKKAADEAKAEASDTAESEKEIETEENENGEGKESEDE